jgi:hypothetical protein
MYRRTETRPREICLDYEFEVETEMIPSMAGLLKTGKKRVLLADGCSRFSVEMEEGDTIEILNDGRSFL